jgi:hypothetical protein
VQVDMSGLQDALRLWTCQGGRGWVTDCVSHAGVDVADAGLPAGWSGLPAKSAAPTGEPQRMQDAVKPSILCPVVMTNSGSLSLVEMSFIANCHIAVGVVVRLPSTTFS